MSAGPMCSPRCLSRKKSSRSVRSDPRGFLARTPSRADMSRRRKAWIPWAVIAAALLVAVLLVNPAQSDAMKIQITINGKPMTGTLIDSATSRDFVSLLPLTLTMNDLFSREKFGHLPRALLEGGERVRSYEVGQVIYW